MMKKITIICFGFSFLIFLLFSQLAYSESETAAFIKKGVGARAAALGGAQVGLADTAEAVYWNPAGLVQLKRTQLSLMHMELFIEDISLDYGGIGYPITEKDVVGVGWIIAEAENIHITSRYYDVREFKFTTTGGPITVHNHQRHTPVGKMENKQNAYFIAYSRDISPQNNNNNKKAYVGVALKFITNKGLREVKYIRPKELQDFRVEKVEVYGVSEAEATKLAALAMKDEGRVFAEPGPEHDADGYSVDIGVLYIPRDDFRFGMNIQNVLGTKLKWSTGRKEKFPLVIRAGIVYKTNFAKLFKQAENTTNDLVLLMDVNKEENRKAIFHVGAEYSLVDAIKVRFGLDDGRITCGLGINVANIILDYAYAEHRLDDLSRISLSYSF